MRRNMILPITGKMLQDFMIVQNKLQLKDLKFGVRTTVDNVHGRKVHALCVWWSGATTDNVMVFKGNGVYTYERHWPNSNNAIYSEMNIDINETPSGHAHDS